jgi:hypothetical protein
MTISQHGGIFGRNPSFNNVNIKRLEADTADINGIIESEEGTIILNGSTISAIQVTIADDAVAALTFPNRGFGILSVVEGANDAPTPENAIWFLGYVDFANTPASTTISAGSFIEIDTTNTLTGTTGTDGRVTLGMRGTSNTLYIENRRGGPKTFNLTLL